MKSSIYIDGSNFYYGLKSLLNDKRFSLLKFNYKAFSSWLAKGAEFKSRYYVGAVRKHAGDEKSEKMYANQQRLFALLSNQNVEYVTGSIIRHPDGVFHEKGVDVRIAVEMIRHARLNEYDRALLLSSDTDLVPAVEEVLSLGKEVQYIGFPHNQSFGLTKATKGNIIILRKEDILKFFPQQSFL